MLHSGWRWGSSSRFGAIEYQFLARGRIVPLKINLWCTFSLVEFYYSYFQVIILLRMLYFASIEVYILMTGYTSLTSAATHLKSLISITRLYLSTLTYGSGAAKLVPVPTKLPQCTPPVAFEGSGMF